MHFDLCKAIEVLLCAVDSQALLASFIYIRVQHYSFMSVQTVV